MRSQRVGSGMVETLQASVTDSLGQTATRDIQVNVIPDAAPEADRLMINAPASAFFGYAIPIQISDLGLADDSLGDGLKVEILEVTSAGAAVVAQTTTQWSSAYFTVRRDSNSPHGQEYRFRVRLTDALGQRDESAERIILLTQVPNAINFVNEGDPAVNRNFVTVGENLPLQVRVVDTSGRPVPNIPVNFQIKPGTGSAIFSGSVSTNLNGLARLNWTATARNGNYQVLAAPAMGSWGIQAAHALQILPGATSHVEFAYVPPVAAGEVFTLRLQARDSAGNAVNLENQRQVRLRIEAPLFHFGFASNIQTTVLTGSNGLVGEEAVVSLVNGQAEVNVSAGIIKGTYPIQIDYPQGGTISSRYDHDGNANTGLVMVDTIPVTVTAGLPVAFDLEQTTQTNHPLGVADRLEVDETASFVLMLIDQYGNRVETLAQGQGTVDADFTVTLAVTGSAQIGGQPNPPPVLEFTVAMADGIQMERGLANFTVFDNVVESVELTLQAVQPEMQGVDTSAAYTLHFRKRLPAILNAAFDLPVDDISPEMIFNFTEAVEESGTGRPIDIRLDDQAVAGLFAIDGNAVRFDSSANIQLDRCYAYHTANSNLRGIEAQDRILEQ
ncbi:MAG TPA: hypothetical protein VGL10_09700, partial [Gammaproteobacteria bacterium]